MGLAAQAPARRRPLQPVPKPRLAAEQPDLRDPSGHAEWPAAPSARQGPEAFALAASVDQMQTYDHECQNAV